MSWKDEYKRALVDCLAQRGTLVSEDPSYYGYYDSKWIEAKRHLETCGVDYAKSSEVYDVEWREFNGTFNEEDDSKQGVEVKVSCRCGEIFNRSFRYDGGMADIIRAITED